MYAHHGVVVVEQKITSGEDPGTLVTGAAAGSVWSKTTSHRFSARRLGVGAGGHRTTEDDLVGIIGERQLGASYARDHLGRRLGTRLYPITMGISSCCRSTTNR